MTEKECEQETVLNSPFSFRRLSFQESQNMQFGIAGFSVSKIKPLGQLSGTELECIKSYSVLDLLSCSK